MYCVYLTTYKGNKLPSFYIGSSTVRKVEDGYRGSVGSKKYQKVFKQELKDNPHHFKTFIISRCETRKEAFLKEEKFQRQLNVVQSPMYINEALASENGYFGRDTSESNNGFYGRKHSEQTLSKMRKPRSEATKAKMRKPKSDSHKEKMIGNTNGKGRMHITIQATCIHCGRTTRKTAITRFHNDKCKHKPK